MGKEGNRLEEVATGEVTDPDEVLIDYGDDTWDKLVLPVGRIMGIRRLARETGLDRSHLLDLFHATASPRAEVRAVVARLLAARAGGGGPAGTGASSASGDPTN